MSLDVLAFIEANFDKVIFVPSKEGQYKVSPCPSCGSTKNKLYVNVDKRVFHCFRCDYGRGEKIERLFHDVGADPKDYIIDDGTPYYDNSNRDAEDKKPKEYVKLLPEEFRDVIGNSSIKAIQALNYLRSRGINDSLIAEYNMGYCYSGKYNNRVIIPYYEDKKLMYFVGRDFTGTQDPKYLNPEWEKTHFLFNFERVKKQSYDFIVLMEGALDILSMPDHAVCLLGKQVSEDQKKILNRYKSIYVMLDNDAILDAYKICESMGRYGGKLFVAELPEGKDPWDIRDNIWEYLKTAKRYSHENKHETAFNTLLDSTYNKLR
jgi:DNA primase